MSAAKREPNSVVTMTVTVVRREQRIDFFKLILSALESISAVVKHVVVSNEYK